MPGRQSGVDAISPAMERTKRQLFMPFRFRHWARLAVVAMSTGELTGGGGGGWSSLGNLHLPAHGSSGKTLGGYTLLPDSLNLHWMDFLPWIVVGMILLFALALAFVYVASVFRFILFDSVLNDRCELGAGWRRWQKQGASYFLWTIGFALAGFAAMVILIGGPVYIAWLTGIFAEPRNHIGLLIVGGVLLFFLALCLILTSAIAALFAKDFVIPVMALENRGVLDGWRRVLPMLSVEKGAYAVYVLMKIVLALASAMLFGIIDVFVLFAFIIPLGIAAVVVVLVGSAAGLAWNTLTLSAAVVAGGGVLMLLIFVMSFVSAPAMVFFQAYALQFFGSRYPLLGAQIDLTSPPPKLPPPITGFVAPLPAS
ncbi:MAG TPA: hypothetical protein VGV68_00425 [Terriglobia bacterium]|nr:hypothetical protein [Terriglobia bacterium]